MQPVAGCPANHPACEQVDNDGEVQPAFAGPHVGDVGAPLLVGPCCREVLIEQVRRDWPGVIAVRGSLEPPLLPSPQAVVAHQPGYPSTTDREAAIPQFPRHPGTAIGAVRQSKGRPDMRQQHHVVALAATGWPTSPGEIAALADAEHTAQAVDREFRFRPIDQREPHRLPSRAKKAVAFFRMSRSCRRISFSRRSRFSSAVTSLSAAAGSTARRSRLRPTHRTSVDSPIPRSPAISRCVRPLVCARRTASSSNSFVNRRCCVIEFLIAHWELSTFPKQVHLKAGVMEDGLVSPVEEGTPQGGPLSPLLSNIVLDELDRELQQRGHRFVRYADDCNIYVRSQRAGERVMRSVSEFITKRLKLKVNEQKSAVSQPSKRKFLGFSFTWHREPKRRIAPKAIARFKQRVRELTRRTRGVRMETMVAQLTRYLTGWRGYFGFCQTPSVLRKLEEWLRRRLRSFVWKQWKRGTVRFAELRKRGVGKDLAAQTAGSAHGPWRLSNSPALTIALPNAYFASLGLTPLVVN